MKEKVWSNFIMLEKNTQEKKKERKSNLEVIFSI